MSLRWRRRRCIFTASFNPSTHLSSLLWPLIMSRSDTPLPLHQSRQPLPCHLSGEKTKQNKKNVPLFCLSHQSSSIFNILGRAVTTQSSQKAKEVPGIRDECLPAEIRRRGRLRGRRDSDSQKTFKGKRLAVALKRLKQGHLTLCEQQTYESAARCLLPGFH